MNVVIISASVGAGHHGAAHELERRLRLAGLTVNRHDFLDLLPAGWGDALRGTYAAQLQYAPASWGWLLRAAAGPRASAGAAVLTAGAATTRMLAAIGTDPTAVVPAYPLATQVLSRLRRTGRLAAPVIAVMTDPSIHPLCVAPGVDLHLAQNAAPALAAVGPLRQRLLPAMPGPAIRGTSH